MEYRRMDSDVFKVIGHPRNRDQISEIRRMLTKFELNQEEDYLAGSIDNAGYRIEDRSPGTGRQGAHVLAYGSETSGPLHGDRRSQGNDKGAELEGCA